MIHRETCRICGGTKLKKVLDLGVMPSANAFLELGELDFEKKYPLVVYFCNDCKLVQLLDVVDAKELWSNYGYLTSASKPLADHFVELGENIVKRYITSKDDLVLEIGGNDGVLLSTIKDRCRVLNIEPAVRIAQLSRKNGVHTWSTYFSRKLARDISLQVGKAKVIVAANVLAHIDDIKDVFRGMELLLDKGGCLIIETHWVQNLIGEGGWDQIYHEHVNYYSFHAIYELVNQFNLKITDVEFIPIHGQSMRVTIEPGRIVGDNFEEGNISTGLNATWGVHELCFLKERKLGLDKFETFQDFNRKVSLNKGELLSCLDLLKWRGKTIAGYGAPAKGNTLINYCDIAEYIDYIVDTTPFKQGRYTPGSHIPIFPPDKMKEAPPDYLLLLAWNYADAIIAKERDFLKAGGHFILPVPEVRII